MKSSNKHLNHFLTTLKTLACCDELFNTDFIEH